MTTPGNVPYFKELAAAPHLVRPDALARTPRDPQFELVHGKRSFGEPPYVIDAYDVGPRIHHTNEYLIYYLPKQRLLFEGDLVRISPDGPLPPAGERAEGLFDAIHDLGLKVERIVQSWPARDRPREFSMTMLADAVRAKRQGKRQP